MTRYRGAIRADLQAEYGVDLAAWWKARRWAALLELIDGLPASSRLNEAQLNDPEVAEQIAEAQAKPDAPRWAPPFREWDTVAMLLAEIRDLQGEVINAILTGTERRPVKNKPFPRPLTEVERARERAERAMYLQALQIFSPHAVDGG